MEKSPRQKAEEKLVHMVNRPYHKGMNSSNNIEYEGREPGDRDWSAINKAGHNEASTFKHLLATLVSELDQETNNGRGRNGIDTRDMIFNICYTEYLNTSNRRVPGQLEEAEEQGYTTACAFNTLTKYMKKEEIREQIQELIMRSASPLKGHEETFAIDATGFSDSRFGQWQNHKYREKQEHRLWKKLHVSCGVRSNIVTAATVTKGTTHDQTQFEKLVEMTDQYFDQGKVVADKAYNARVNYDKVSELGGKAYIPFKDNVTGKAGGSYEWMRMYKRFQSYRRDFLQKYHLRSNVESSFNVIKEKFGKNLRCKESTALETEVLAKVLCYNICTIIRMTYCEDLQCEWLERN